MALACVHTGNHLLCDLSQGPTQLPETAHSQPWLHTGLATEALKGRIAISKGGPGGHRIFRSFSMSPLCSQALGACREELN